MANIQSRIQFAVCVANDGCDDLTTRKIYRILPDEDAAREEYLRVVDDSGEDYLYPADRFCARQRIQNIATAIVGCGRI